MLRNIDLNTRTTYTYLNQCFLWKSISLKLTGIFYSCQYWIMLCSYILYVFCGLTWLFKKKFSKPKQKEREIIVSMCSFHLKENLNNQNVNYSCRHNEIDIVCNDSDCTLWIKTWKVLSCDIDTLLLWQFVAMTTDYMFLLLVDVWTRQHMLKKWSSCLTYFDSIPNL